MNVEDVLTITHEGEDYATLNVDGLEDFEINKVLMEMLLDLGAKDDRDF